MRKRIIKSVALLTTGMVFGILPGCVEAWLLNVATPFLLNR